MSSNVIKARTLDVTERPAVVKRNVQIALRDANEIVARAQEEARQIVSEARLKATEICESARHEGYESGAAQWHGALAEAWKSRDAYLAGNETALVKLAVKIAEKLIGEELQSKPETIVGIVNEAMRSVRRARSIAIQVHPADVVFVKERVGALRTAARAARDIEVVPNAALSRGDCIVETDIGIIDARLQTQLNNIERALTFSRAT